MMCSFYLDVLLWQLFPDLSGLVWSCMRNTSKTYRVRNYETYAYLFANNLWILIVKNVKLKNILNPQKEYFWRNISFLISTNLCQIVSKRLRYQNENSTNNDIFTYVILKSFKCSLFSNSSHTASPFFTS